MTDDLDDIDMPEPPPPSGRYGLTRRQNFIGDRLERQMGICWHAEKAIAPFVNDEISKVIIRIRGLFDTAHRMMNWSDYEGANKIADQVDGALRELKTLMRNTPSKRIAERIFNL